jgi:hypothetical protein
MFMNAERQLRSLALPSAWQYPLLRMARTTPESGDRFATEETVRWRDRRAYAIERNAYRRVRYWDISRERGPSSAALGIACHVGSPSWVMSA